MKTSYASVAATNVPDNLNDGGRHGNLNANTATAPLSRALQQQHQPDSPGPSTSATAASTSVKTLRCRMPSPLSVLAASPDRTCVVVGGRDVLKVLTVRETDITDVKWANAFAPQMIASAYLNGDIAVWDIQ
ncbi:hypothetical protein HDU77_001119, partial [Chytriomyces hyalinus]